MSEQELEGKMAYLMCPLRAITGGASACTREACAWWCELVGKCAIRVLAWPIVREIDCLSRKAAVVSRRQFEEQQEAAEEYERLQMDIINALR